MEPGRGGPRVLIGLFFFPRGGSAQLVRVAVKGLPSAGLNVRLASGSVGRPGDYSHARTYFGDLAHVVSYDRDGVPFPPSFEDRPGAPDAVFASVAGLRYRQLVRAWQRALRRADGAQADVLYLHHLTPANEAARRCFPRTPVVGHLHGTELSMVGRIVDGAPTEWRHAQTWLRRMRRWAADCDRLIVGSPAAARDAVRLLAVPADRVVTVPNGVDLARFVRAPRVGADRVTLWRRWLVEDPRGWEPSGGVGSIRYRPQDIAAFAGDGPVLLYVGRFLAVKRLPLLIRSYARAWARFTRRAPLVLVGGYPGEFEGTHPADLVRAYGVPDVFLAGWRDSASVANMLNAGDVLVLPAVGEQFGQVLLEAMACGVPVIAADSHGPATVVRAGESGWLVTPDDETALAAALVHAINDPAERRRRGEVAYRTDRHRYAAPHFVAGVADVLRSAAGAGRAADPDGPTWFWRRSGRG